MNTEQLRAEFEAWTDNHYYLSELNNIYLDDDYVDPEMQAAWEGYQAGRAALQSQSRQPEISRHLLGKIVDEVFDGATEDASVIEDIYRVVARECALQSQDREDEVEFQIGIEGEVQAQTFGPREQAWAEIQRYAAQYAEDGPIEIWEVTRRRVE